MVSLSAGPVRSCRHRLSSRRHERRRDLIALIRASDSPARTILLLGFIGVLGLNQDNTGADELILKSNKEVPNFCGPFATG